VQQEQGVDLEVDLIQEQQEMLEDKVGHLQWHLVEQLIQQQVVEQLKELIFQVVVEHHVE
jgi:hypothetical protein|tara:strand:- start:449 stop:628 length:180 start_codon:yes stop_codon:yes gene_type:complete